jgi:hypothetical protein
MQCPKCQFEQDENALECARCGIVFRKTHDASVQPMLVPSRARAVDDDEDGLTWRERLVRLAFHVPESVAPSTFIARGVLIAILFIWWIVFLVKPMGDVNDSYLHLINLPFHEAGHILFIPFGRFLSVLGGSLLQVIVPLVCMGALLRSRDTVGAAATLWWAGQNLVDLAPYIADARALQMPLLGGRTGAEVEGHDYEYLLQTLGWLQHDVALGRAARGMGLLIMLLAVVWGAVMLFSQRRRLRARAENL